MRIDKWLWCVRLFKTRSISTKAVNGGKVKLNGKTCKASKELKTGDCIHVNKGLLELEIEVTAFPKQRLPAKEVEEYLINNTPQSEYDKLATIKLAKAPYRDKGSGRPTKKDRRDIDKWGFWD